MLTAEGTEEHGGSQIPRLVFAATESEQGCTSIARFIRRTNRGDSRGALRSLGEQNQPA